MTNILLLEDLPEIRSWLKQLVLQVFPNSLISEAARVHDARELITAVKFDLALVDLGLPDGSGVDVVAALRESQPEAQSVVVTIHDNDDHTATTYDDDNSNQTKPKPEIVCLYRDGKTPAVPKSFAQQFHSGAISDREAGSRQTRLRLQPVRRERRLRRRDRIQLGPESEGSLFGKNFPRSVSSR